jgi:hypothetical protein
VLPTQGNFDAFLSEIVFIVVASMSRAVAFELEWRRG